MRADTCDAQARSLSHNGAGPSFAGGSALIFQLLSGVLGASLATSAAAQTAPGSSDDIIVIGQRPLLTRPFRSIAGPDLTAYGAGTIGELLDEVVRESGDRVGAATVLVDGKRVPGLGDIDSYPAEALERIEVLPRESGARAGAPAGSRVYNVVLKRETRLLVGLGRLRGASDGGARGATAEGSATRIRRPQRLNASILLRGDEALLESERSILQPAGSPLDLGQFRTLRPKSSAAVLSLSAADRLLPWLDGLARVKLGETQSRSLLGLDDSGSRVTRTARSRSFDLSGQLTGERDSWSFSVDFNHRSNRRRLLTVLNAVARPMPTLTTTSGVELLAHGPLLDFGSGPMHLTLGAALRRDTVGQSGSGATGSRFADTQRDVRAEIDVPLFSKAASLLGDVAFRAAISRGQSRAFGTTQGRSISLRWSPAEWLHLSAQDSRSRTAPAIDLVAEPLLETAGVRTFDFFRRETVDLVTVTGGQFDLPSQRTHTQRLTAELRRSSSVDLIVTAEFLALRNINVLSVLPPASDIVLRLFPERFTRDPSGRLTRIDLRPVIFPGQKEEELRTAVNLVAPFPAGSSSGRLQVNGSLRLLLSSKLQLTPAIGSVDLLDRGAIGLGGAMRPRINLDFTFGYSDRGLGVRLGGEHRSQSFLGGTGEAGALTFAPLTLFSLRVFAEGSRLQALSPLLRNTRISLAVQNLANRREQVSDEVGVVPLAYQAALRDPVGRSIEIELRRTF